MATRRNLTDQDIRIMKQLVKDALRQEMQTFAQFVDRRFRDLHQSLNATVADIEEGIEHMDDLVKRASEVAERSNTVTAGFQAWWDEVKGRLDNAVNAGDMQAIRSALDTIDQNTTKFGNAIASGTGPGNQPGAGGAAGDGGAAPSS